MNVREKGRRTRDSLRRKEKEKETGKHYSSLCWRSLHNYDERALCLWQIWRELFMKIALLFRLRMLAWSDHPWGTRRSWFVFLLPQLSWDEQQIQVWTRRSHSLRSICFVTSVLPRKINGQAWIKQTLFVFERTLQGRSPLLFVVQRRWHMPETEIDGRKRDYCKAIMLNRDPVSWPR